VPTKGLCSWHCTISKGLLKFSMCCGGTVTEFNTQKMAYIPLRDILRFYFHDKVHKHVLTLQAPTPHWGTAKPCHCKWGWRKDQGQRLSVLAGCSIASTARRKLISILNCQTSHVLLSRSLRRVCWLIYLMPSWSSINFCVIWWSLANSL